MMSSSGRSSSSNVYPFTTTQWQELEHQALVFKYMISGLQIPQDLLFTIRRSLDDSSLSSKLLLHHPPPPPQHMSIGWSAYHHQQQQMGLGYHHHRKIDAEPGRCRRTDGKKWRCSREAYTDSKYCERHMHRGRNRSRKPVENTILSSPPPTTKPSTNSNTNPAIPTTINNNNAHHSSSAQSHFLYSHNTPPSSSGIPFPSTSQQCTTKFFMESNPYRNSHGREIADEHRFLSSEINSSNGVNDSSLKMGSALFQMKENSSAYNSSGLENWQQQLQSLTRQHNHHDYCCNNSYSSYYDHHMRPPLSIDDGEEADHQHQTKKVMHHFLDSWPDSEDHRHHKSVPNSLHDFFMTEKW